MTVARWMAKSAPKQAGQFVAEDATAGAMRMPIGGPQDRPTGVKHVRVPLANSRFRRSRCGHALAWRAACSSLARMGCSLVRTLRPFGVTETLLFFDSVFTGSRVGRDDERSTAPVGQRRVRFCGIAKCRSDAADDSRPKLRPVTARPIFQKRVDCSFLSDPE